MRGPVRRSLVSRAVAVLSVLTLALVLQGGSTNAGAQAFNDPDGELAFTITGGPFALVGDVDSCAGSGHLGSPAHLSLPMTITITGAPEGTTSFRLTIGSKQHLNVTIVPPATSFTLAAEQGTGLNCNDASAVDHSFLVKVSAIDSSTEHGITETLIAELTLTNID